MSFNDEFGLLKTWKNLDLSFVSKGFASTFRGASFRDAEGSSISFSFGNSGAFMLDFSRIQQVSLITKNEYLKEFSSQLSSAVPLPATIGACLRVVLGEGFMVYLLENKLLAQGT